MRYTKPEEQQLLQQTQELLALKGQLPSTQPEIEALAFDLSRCIEYHEWRYYILHQPVVSDYEYDLLFQQLKALEAAHPWAIRPDSPTQRVSSDLSEGFATVEHLTPMLSLENSYHAEDLREFDKRLRKLLLLGEDETIAYCVEPKFDGGTIALVYENDQLLRAATRGNGQQGEEITANAKAIRSIPLKAAFSQLGIQKAEMRGEVLLRKDTFERLNEQRAKQGEELFANPRNAATGGLRMKDPRQVAERSLEAFVYQLGYWEGQAQFQTHDEMLQKLAQLGFKVPQADTERKLCQGIDEVIAFCADWEARREEYAYEIDGMVIKANSLSIQQSTGYTNHHPRWAIAFKFKAKQATTKLLDVEFQVGRTGAITPVAKLQPVELAGVTITSVSLHNADLIKEKDLRLGDLVLVERAGDVIPQIVKPLADLRTGKEKIIGFPTHCPACSSALERPKGEAVWRCVNPDCAAQTLGRYIHFVSKDAMNIDGLGESILERFYQEGWLNSIADLYRLDFEAIAKLEGFGKRSAQKLSQALEASKANPLHRLIYGLGIRHVGKTNSKTLAAAVEKIQDLAQYSVEDLMKLEDIGPKVAQALHQAFAQPKTLALLEDLEKLGLNTKRLAQDEKPAADANAPLSGKTVLFTGTLPSLTREEAQKLVAQNGGKPVSSISSKLSYLVAGEEAGSKLKKAQELGIPILTEAEFLALIKK